MTIPEQIATELARRGLTVYRLARMSGVSRQTIHAGLASGNMSTRIAERLMRALDLGVSAIEKPRQP
jgi:lambda repressor-like predicted transcriptional regulator